MDKRKDEKARLARRNSSAGKRYEVVCIRILRAIGFPHLHSTRAVNRHRDGEGIDISNINEAENGRFPYNIQCKNVSGHVKYHDLLAKIPVIKGIINVVLHKFTDNDNRTRKFIPQGFYAIMHDTDFFQIVAERMELEKLRQYMMVLTKEEMIDLDNRIKPITDDSTDRRRQPGLHNSKQLQRNPGPAGLRLGEGGGEKLQKPAG